MSYAVIQITVHNDGRSEFAASQFAPLPDGSETEESLGEHELMALLHHALAEYHRTKQVNKAGLMVVRGRG